MTVQQGLISETCALTSWEKPAPLLDSLDIVYIDIKHMDETRHLEWTGASNRVILENMHGVAEHNQVILSIPVVPGFNDSAENIFQSAKFAQKLGINILRPELLPYLPFGRHGYDELEKEYPLQMIQPPSGAHMEELRELIRATASRLKSVVDVRINKIRFEENSYGQFTG